MGLHVGDTSDVYADFIPDGGVLTDPSAPLTVVVQSPSQRLVGATTVYTYLTSPNVKRISTGKYLVEIDVTEEGKWTGAWESPGPICKGVQPFYLDVDPLPFTSP